MRIGCVLRDLVKGEMKIMLRYMEHEERACSSGSLGFNQRRNFLWQTTPSDLISGLLRQ